MTFWPRWSESLKRSSVPCSSKSGAISPTRGIRLHNATGAGNCHSHPGRREPDRARRRAVARRANEQPCVTAEACSRSEVHGLLHGHTQRRDRVTAVARSESEQLRAVGGDEGARRAVARLGGDNDVHPCTRATGGGKVRAARYLDVDRALTGAQ